MPNDGYLEILEIGGWETRLTSSARRPHRVPAVFGRLDVLAAATCGTPLLLLADAVVVVTRSIGLGPDRSPSLRPTRCLSGHSSSTFIRAAAMPLVPGNAC